MYVIEVKVSGKPIGYLGSTGKLEHQRDFARKFSTPSDALACVATWERTHPHYAGSLFSVKLEQREAMPLGR